MSKNHSKRSTRSLIDNRALSFQRLGRAFICLALSPFAVGCASGADTTSRQEGTGTTTQAIETTATGLEATVSTRADGYVPVFGGVLVHPSCRHKVPNGAKISASGEVTIDGKVTEQLPPCTHPPKFNDTGWIENATASAVPNFSCPQYAYFTELTDVMTVPSNPTCTSCAALGFFPSFTGPGKSIIQPVLAWNPASGGGFWTLIDEYINASGQNI
jgi:hypothetical protein